MGLLWQIYIFLFLSLGVWSSDGTRELFVKPTDQIPDLACSDVSVNHCLTLNEYIEQSSDYFSSNTTFVFLEGHHELDKDCLINNTVGITLKSDLTARGSVSIDCRGQTRFRFSNVSGLVIENIAFISCGISSPTPPLPGIVLKNVNHTELINVTITNSSAGGLVIQGNNISIMNILIEKNHQVNTTIGFPSGMMATNSIISLFGNNTFTQNGLGRTVFSQANYTEFDILQTVFLAMNTQLVVHGVLTVTNNTSPSGIVIIQSGHAVIDGNIRFFQNNAFLFGALFFQGTKVNLSGEAYFSDNCGSFSSSFPVAGMSVQRSVLQIDGKIVFSNNSADVSSIAASDSYISINGVMMDTNSHGRSGIFLLNSGMINNGSTVFLDSTVNGSFILASGNSVISITGNLSFYNISKASPLLVDHSELWLSGEITFKNNFGILYSYHSFISIDGTSTFVDNSINGNYGSITIIGNSTLFIKGEFLFERNEVSGFDGGGIIAISSTVNFQGNGQFVNNTAGCGGAIFGSDSVMSFEGNATFINNSATNGGAMCLKNGSRVELKAQATLTFERNYASKGGAIFVKDVILPGTCSGNNNVLSRYQIPPCFIDIGPNVDNTTLRFQNNTAATKGSVLYGGMLESCTDQAESNMTKEIFMEQSSKNDDDTMLYEIYSDPFKLCFCENGNVSCDKRDCKINATRGQRFSVKVAVLSQTNQAIQGLVRINLKPQYKAKKSSLDGNLQYLENDCTDLNFTIYSENEREELVMFAEGPCKDSTYAQRTIQVNFTDCPLGLHLNSDRCTCDEKISKYTNSCDINGIMKVKNAWIMAHENNTYSIVKNCPLDYCMEPPFELNLNDSDHQCNNNRTGIACGRCARNLSLILGSTKCMDCSDNSSLALLLVFAVLGVLLVAVLFLLQLTVANGAINGLILYANIVNANRVMFSLHGTFWLFKVFISWLNLDFGIETCFHDGLDQLAKTAWQFVFPVYLLLLVGAIIVVCHYSIRTSNILSRSNPVAVLATIILLSYTKLLQNIIEIFSPASIHLPDNTTKTVWRYDGNVELFASETPQSASWLVLFVVALLVLVVLFLPFTFILFSAQILQRVSPISSCLNKLRLTPFINAYHAPYKPSTRFWLGLCLLVRCIILIVVANDEGLVMTLLAILAICFVLYSIIGMARGIYSNRWPDALEISFILNLGLFSAIAFYVKFMNLQHHEETISIVANISISITFLTFIIIVIAQLVQQLKERPCFNNMRELAKNKIKTQRSHTNSLESSETVSPKGNKFNTATSQELTILPDKSCRLELREPLLDE